MIYAANVLSSVVANWQVSDGNVSRDNITLNAGGVATQNIDLSVLPTIPEFLMISVVASQYSDNYKSDFIAAIQVITESGAVHTYNIPVVDTGGGVCIIELPVTSVKHSSLSFSFISKVPTVITEYALFPPMMSEVDLTEVLDRLPRLLNDYNEAPMTITQRETLVALISSYVTETTELTGKFTLSYIASEETEIIIRIKDNEVSELYTPMKFKLHKGTGTIGIPHGYLTKLQGYHNFTVTAQLIRGDIKILTRQVSYIIDGGRIAYGVIDIGSVAYDVTIRKLASESRASFMYAACIDEGMFTVKRAEYTDTPGTAWVTILNIGPAIDAAIEFNGEWAFNKNPYTFNTEEEPWIAWVTPEGVLNTRMAYTMSVPTVLATNVSKVSIVKGWDNTLFVGQDHGLIYVYIRGGTPYYRAYAVQPNGVRAWEPERTLDVFTGTAVDVSAFRTNDYRVGISVLDTSGITYTYFTERNWAGIGVEAHTIRTRAEVLIDFLPITYYMAYEYERITVKADVSADLLFARQDNSITRVENVPITRINEEGVEYQDWGFAVRVRFNYEVIGTPVITLIDPVVQSTFSVLRIEEIEPGYEYLVLVDAGVHEFGFNTVEADLNVEVTSFTNAAGYNYDTIITSFMPVQLVPPLIPVPEVEEVWNE